jgi:Tn3 transposase DDE domain
MIVIAQKAGKRQEIEMLKRISPIAWRHINLRGRFEFQKQTSTLNIDEIISTLGQKTNWQQLEEFEEMLEQAPYFTFSVR